MTHDDWNHGHTMSVAVFLNGEAISEPDSRGGRVLDDSFLMLINGHYEPVPFTLPGPEYGERWQCCLDTADPAGTAARPAVKAREVILVSDRSFTLFRRTEPRRPAPSRP
jgi:glycogen operon protein